MTDRQGERLDGVDRGETLVRAVLDRLVAGGARLTRPRRAVVGVMVAGGHPQSVGEVVAASGVSQSSAYRILVDLEARGLVTRIVGGDDLGRYELSHELAGRHHHLMCADCGLVVDIDLPAELEEQLAQQARHAEPDLAIVLERFDLVGRCGTCR